MNKPQDIYQTVGAMAKIKDDKVQNQSSQDENGEVRYKNHV